MHGYSVIGGTKKKTTTIHSRTIWPCKFILISILLSRLRWRRRGRCLRVTRTWEKKNGIMIKKNLELHKWTKKCKLCVLWEVLACTLYLRKKPPAIPLESHRLLAPGSRLLALRLLVYIHKINSGLAFHKYWYVTSKSRLGGTYRPGHHGHSLIPLVRITGTPIMANSFSLEEEATSRPGPRLQYWANTREREKDQWASCRICLWFSDPHVVMRDTNSYSLTPQMNHGIPLLPGTIKP